jgi:hypothetical protein
MSTVSNSKLSLISKWSNLETPAKVGVGVGGLVVSGIFIALLKVLIVGLGIFGLIALLFVPYWIPTIIAFRRKHPSKLSIFALNMFLGWTFFFWIISLVWSLSNNQAGQTPTIVINNISGSPTDQTLPTPPPAYKVGQVVNGYKFNGQGWDPVAEDLQPAAPIYKKGDVVNGHRFNGTSWELI